jgi:hypothetical protein
VKLAEPRPRVKKTGSSGPPAEIIRVIEFRGSLGAGAVSSGPALKEAFQRFSHVGSFCMPRTSRYSRSVRLDELPAKIANFVHYTGFRSVVFRFRMKTNLQQRESLFFRQANCASRDFLRLMRHSSVLTARQDAGPCVSTFDSLTPRNAEMFTAEEIAIIPGFPSKRSRAAGNPTPGHKDHGDDHHSHSEPPPRLLRPGVRALPEDVLTPGEKEDQRQ